VPTKTVTRVDITAATVKEAAALAAEKAPSVRIWADKKAHYLMIRQRGGAADWIVKTRGKTRVLGDIRERRPGFLSVRMAREKAATLYGQIANGEDPRQAPPPAEAAGWTWGDLSKRWQARLKEIRVTKSGRLKHPRKGTQDDVRLAVGKPSIVALEPKLLADLRPIDLIVANRNVPGFRQRSKCLAYMQSALNWALSQFPDQAGLLDIRHPWWMDIAPAQMSGDEGVAQKHRREERADDKNKIAVDDLAEILVRHEEFCVGKTAEDKISPGIRWGLWWLMLTGNRRFSATALERERLLQTDEFGQDGWGRAMWPEWMMKGGAEFWLPLPPAVLAIANGSIADYTVLVRNEHRVEWPSKWVFASTRRLSYRDDGDPVEEIVKLAPPDVAVYPNSLNAHLRSMRGEKKRLDGTFGENVLAGVPYYTLHFTRTVITNTLDKIESIPKAAISAMLAHAGEKTDDRLSRTTAEFYHTNQRMDLKSLAIKAWSEALIEAFLKAGGRMPEPRETIRRSWIKPKAPIGMIGAGAVFPARPAE
jgi:hypothetical protein